MAQGDGKRIAKNTLFLYLRMLVSVVVSLYTVRVIWQVLGVDNYGIYNVVGGVVLLFQFINMGMVASSQRFISYELGRGNLESLKKVFTTSLITHALLAVTILVITETVGLWFVTHKLNIPEERETAAFWVYQCSILALMVTTISVPYTSCIVAHEHMKAFGYLGIVEVVLKLVIVFLLLKSTGDKLIVYAILVLEVSLIMRMLYGLYCKRHFQECVIVKQRDKGLIKNMFAFAGWSFLGNMGFSIREQGLNIVLNMYFNIAINAAKGIGSQVNGIINGFVMNFQTAVQPQITQRYARGEVESMMDLVKRSSKFSFFLLLMVVAPFFAACPYVLELWLKDVAPYTVSFMRLILLVALVDAYVGPLVIAMQATGRIRNFQIIIFLIMSASIPLAIAWLAFEHNPLVIIYATLATSLMGLVARLMLLHALVHFRYSEFIGTVFVPSVPVAVISIAVLYWVYGLVAPSLLWLAGFCVISLVTVTALVMIIGLSRSERELVIGWIKKKLFRK